ncbi:hypothetical protein T484DRAFT_1861365 [Baffinella frigidus]|nr:hypothetical protein T484DRAFT_1861365 [Cryptophyta sp. CCMP2293]
MSSRKEMEKLKGTAIPEEVYILYAKAVKQRANEEKRAQKSKPGEEVRVTRTKSQEFKPARTNDKESKDYLYAKAMKQRSDDEKQAQNSKSGEEVRVARTKSQEGLNNPEKRAKKSRQDEKNENTAKKVDATWRSSMVIREKTDTKMDTKMDTQMDTKMDTKKGGTCYLNAVLQVLNQCPAFVQYFCYVEQMYGDGEPDTPVATCLVYQLDQNH